MIGYTTVIGVDGPHIKQLKMVWPTWKLHKPSILKNPLIVFYDADSTVPQLVREIVDHPNLCVVRWPPPPSSWPPHRYIFNGDGHDKWSNPQRHKMLAGFVHIPYMWVETKYWLKLDLDVVATGRDDWIDEKWFDQNPAIIAPSWNYTKPADQIMKLDAWSLMVGFDGIEFKNAPLGIFPNPGSDLVRHKRICSWCAFFNTEFTKECSRLCRGEYNLPVPSQDGFMWYIAQRMGYKIVNFNPKKLGWKLGSSNHNVGLAVEEALR